MRPVFRLLEKLRAHKARKAFETMTADIDQQIAVARKKHQPIRHLEAIKRELVHRTEPASPHAWRGRGA